MKLLEDWQTAPSGQRGVMTGHVGDGRTASGWIGMGLRLEQDMVT